MTLWLRATKWVSGRQTLVAGPSLGRDRELVAQSHKGWSA